MSAGGPTPGRRPGRLSIRDLAGAYRGADRFHVAVRLRTCPFAAIDALLPMEGAIVDVACGHGHLALLLASGAPGRRVTGVDIDTRKVGLARQAAADLGLGSPRTRFEVVADGWRPEGPVEAVTIVDALYLFPPADRTAVLRAAAASLAPGGLLLVKEMDMARRAKAAVARAGEQVMTRMAHVTASVAGDLEFTPPDEIAATMAAAGLVAEVQRWDRGYPVPHVAVVGRRPRA